MQSDWGRVADDGTVFVRTSTGERSVGSYPEGTPEEALRFFTERYEALAFEVQLLEQRITSGVLAPDDAVKSVATVRDQVVDAHAVGDLDGLVARLEALAPVIEEQRAVRKAERAAKQEKARATKEELVAAAEKISAGNDWRHGANLLRELLDQWKQLPRLDRATDDALWRRFSTARTSYTRRRKTHFAELNVKREAAQQIKERLCKEAEALADSTDWGRTAGQFRDLMREWKAAGPAPKEVDDQLWKRFRGAQDTFFEARDAASSALDAEFAANAEVKDGLILELEALLPIGELEAAKQAFRQLAERWDAAGKVPRDRVKELEARFRKVEQAVRSAEDDQWRNSDPEKSARADDMINKLEAGIAEIEEKIAAARDAGDEKRAKRLEKDLESRREFLEMAKRTAADFG